MSCKGTYKRAQMQILEQRKQKNDFYLLSRDKIRRMQMKTCFCLLCRAKVPYLKVRISEHKCKFLQE